MSILSRYELFVFDWDHTLTTSTIAVTILNFLKERSDSQILQKRDKSGAQQKMVKGVRIREKVGPVYSVFDDLYGIVFKPKLKHGSDGVLELLRKHRKKVAIFSDSKNYRLMKEARALGILGHVDFALSSEAIGYYKPNPTGLLLLMDKFRVEKGRCIYIGDMVKDVVTARLAGIDSCAIADGVGSYEALREAKPRFLYVRMDSFLKALEQGK